MPKIVPNIDKASPAVLIFPRPPALPGGNGDNALALKGLHKSRRLAVHKKGLAKTGGNGFAFAPEATAFTFFSHGFAPSNA